MAYRKLGRNSSNRKALFRSILTAFFKHGRIETTITKAKEVASKSAQLITLPASNRSYSANIRKCFPIFIFVFLPKIYLTNLFHLLNADQHTRRQVLAVLVDEEVTKKLFEEIAPKYEGRQGGFTRIYRVGPRRGDAAEMAIIELI